MNKGQQRIIQIAVCLMRASHDMANFQWIYHQNQLATQNVTMKNKCHIYDDWGGKLYVEHTTNKNATISRRKKYWKNIEGELCRREKRRVEQNVIHIYFIIKSKFRLSRDTHILVDARIWFRCSFYVVYYKWKNVFFYSLFLPFRFLSFSSLNLVNVRFVSCRLFLSNRKIPRKIIKKKRIWHQ